MKEIFSANLRTLRGARTQTQMAQLLAMPQPMYARYESGRRLPSSDVLYRICKITGASSDWLLGLDDNQKVGHSITANNSAVSIHGNANNQDCSKCEFMKAAIKKLNK